MAPVKPDFPDHYFDLGVASGATLAEIKAAYHKLALLHHPDKKGVGHVKDDADFKRISAAWEVLRDVQERAEYDIKYSAWVKYWSELGKEEGGSKYCATEEEEQEEVYESSQEEEEKDPFDAQMKRLLEQLQAFRDRKWLIQREPDLHSYSMETVGATINRWGGCECDGCKARYDRLDREKVFPPPKRSNAYEWNLLQAYQRTQRRKQQEEAERARKREAERKAAEEAERAASAARAAERAKREAEERRRREEQEKKAAAAARRKQEAAERTRMARERTVQKRSEEVARRIRVEQERTARLRMAKAYIDGEKDALVATLQEQGRLPSAEEVDRCIGWKKKKGATTCLFCEDEIKHFSFQLPDGDAAACNPCKKQFSHVTIPVEE